MKKRFTEEQIIKALKEHSGVRQAADIVRELGVSEQTFYSFIESFNGRFRSKCINLNRFNSLNDAREIISRWKDEYNMFRPKVSLGDMTPVEYARTLKNHAATKVASGT